MDEQRETRFGRHKRLKALTPDEPGYPLAAPRNYGPHWLSHLPDGWMRGLSCRELLVLQDYKEWNTSITELWAWRGDILRKYGLEVPPPEEFLPDGDDHPIFQPWQITESRTFNSAGECASLEYFRRGRKLAPSSPHIKEYLKQISIREN